MPDDKKYLEYINSLGTTVDPMPIDTVIQNEDKMPIPQPFVKTRQVLSAPGAKLESAISEFGDRPVSAVMDILSGTVESAFAPISVLSPLLEEAQSPDVVLPSQIKESLPLAKGAVDLFFSPVELLGQLIESGLWVTDKVSEELGLFTDKDLAGLLGVSPESVERTTQSTRELGTTATVLAVMGKAGRALKTQLKKPTTKLIEEPAKPKFLEQETIVRGFEQKRTDLLRRSNEIMNQIESIEPKGSASRNKIADLKREFNKNQKELKRTNEQYDRVVIEKAPIEERGAISDAVRTIRNEQETVGGNIRASEVSKVFDQDVRTPFKKYLQPISDEIGQLSKPLFRRTREYYFDVGRELLSAEKSVKNYVGKTNILKRKNPALFEEYELALANMDKIPEALSRVNEIAKEGGFLAEYQKIQKIKEFNADLLSTNKLENHFPRRVKDHAGLLEEMSKRLPPEDVKRLNDAVARIKGERIEKIPIEERIDLMNSILRGYRKSTIPLRDLQSMQERMIPILDSKLKQYYYDSNTAIAKHIKEQIELKHQRQLFGELPSRRKPLPDIMNEEGLTDLQKQKAQELFTDLFNPKVLTNKYARALRDFTYITKLGQFPRAFKTQLKDMGLALSINPRLAIKSVYDIFRKRDHSKLENLGIDPAHSIAELLDPKGFHTTINKLMKGTGFTFADLLGKRTVIETRLNWYKNQLKKPNPEFHRRLERFFGKGEEKAKVIKDLREGKTTDSVNFLLFNEVSEAHPVTLAEVPRGFIKGGNWRMAYALKTFGARRLSQVLNETIRTIRDESLPLEQRRQGYKNFMKLIPMLTAWGASLDSLYDLLSTKDPDMSGRLGDNFLDQFMMSRFELREISKKGVQSLGEQAIPPAADIPRQALTLDKQLIKDIPIFGSLYYDWFIRKKKKRKF